MIAAVLLLCASLLVLGTGLGLLRLPDALSRLHASTKAASLGGALALTGAVAEFRDPWSVLLTLLTLGFVFVTSPVGAQAIASRIANRPAGTPGPRQPPPAKRRHKR